MTRIWNNNLFILIDLYMRIINNDGSLKENSIYDEDGEQDMDDHDDIVETIVGA